MKAIIEVNMKFRDVGIKEIEKIIEIISPMEIKLNYIGDIDKVERNKIYGLLNLPTSPELDIPNISFNTKIRKLKKLQEFRE